MSIEVFHAIKPTFGCGDEPVWPDAYTRVATVDTDDIDCAYEFTNTIDKCWWENAGVTPHFSGKGCRSTSVGDILLTREGAFRCANIGWDKLNWVE